MIDLNEKVPVRVWFHEGEMCVARRDGSREFPDGMDVDLDGYLYLSYCNACDLLNYFECAIEDVIATPESKDNVFKIQIN